MSSRAYAAPIGAFDAERDVPDDQNLPIDDAHPLGLQGQQGIPLSPATSESSGPHSPSTGLGAYPVGMPQESPTAHKSMHAEPGYYFGQPFVPKNDGYWPGVPPMPPVSQYGY